MNEYICIVNLKFNLILFSEKGGLHYIVRKVYCAVRGK